ncbi:MAG: hypothetical protein KDE31_32875 [Caldilineaceae bacterium]|nr:hypothetical protein [Caldilineaceae bacterium]
MSTATITISNMKIELTLEQLIAAIGQLQTEDRAKLARALADTELDADLARLIAELYSKPPIEDVSDEIILSEIRAVRRQRG